MNGCGGLNQRLQRARKIGKMEGKVCSDGGIGIRTGLKILGLQGIEGSSPSPSIKAKKETYPKPRLVLGNHCFFAVLW